MSFGKKITKYSVNNPKLLTTIIIILTAVIAAIAVLPSIMPDKFPSLNSLKVDTDPENMLPANEFVRVFHNEKKKEFSLHEIIVLGIVNETHEQGVFNARSLNNIFELTEYAKTLSWQDEKKGESGVIAREIISPSTVDNIEQGGVGEVKFEWLMPGKIKNDDEALAIRKKADRLPFLKGSLISENGKAVCIYLPITAKDVSAEIYYKLQEKIATLEGDDEYHITGLPVANDTFGVEMFKQMAISAPVAMAVIFLLMFIFFRKLILIISPMIIAMISVIITMGLLIISGQTIHIMSSMIPIFIMPIAVLDSVHILSEFFDLYQKYKDKKKTVLYVMSDLFMPMLYTSMTSVAGFVSLALTPIPPVQVFGIFVGLGVCLAWLLTVTFIPAFIMMIPERMLSGFGSTHHENDTFLSKLMRSTGAFTYKNAKLVLSLSLVIIVIAIFGITKIEINDNPVKWFNSKHPIRIADKQLNKHFGGTYMSYLNLSSNIKLSATDIKKDIENYLAGKEIHKNIKIAFKEKLKKSSFKEVKKTLKDLSKFAEDQSYDANDEEYESWDKIITFLGKLALKEEVFKDPETLKYVARLQEELLKTGIVGKSNSVADMVKTVHRELLNGDEKAFSIPESKNAVAQCLLTYQNSHRPSDLWHFVTPDYKNSSLWLQLKSGNNKDMVKVVKAIDAFFLKNPPPNELKHQWFGLTYINVVWQKKMVFGMLKAFMGSFLVVFLMMALLFKSPLWGLLSMIPLTITIGFIYGSVGIIGKDYDMPIAVLSSLTLGLAVDFAIHFLSRYREVYKENKSMEQTTKIMFDEPARAISRNIIVIAVGFMPLLFAPLVPYKTVGAFLATILSVAGLTTLFILPSLIKVLANKLLNIEENLICSCTNFTVIFLSVVGIILLNFDKALGLSFKNSILIMIITTPLAFIISYFIKKGRYCKN